MRTTFKILLNVATTGSFFLALTAIYLVANTSDRALELHQTSESPEEMTTTRVDACHGGLWIMQLCESPNPQSAGLYYLPRFRSDSKITWVETGWEQRLSSKQTGPIYLGFCTNPSSFQKNVPAIDRVTNQPATQTILAEGRITRIPFAAIITLLFSLPTARCILAIRRRRARSQIDRSLASNCRAFFFNAAVITSTLFLIATLFEWRRAQTVDLNMNWSRSWKAQPSSDFSDHSVTSELDFTPAGWQLTHMDYVSSELRTAPDSTLWITQASLDQILFKTTPVTPAIHLGFGFGQKEETVGPNGNIHRRAWTAVIPHWAMAIVFAIFPATWLLQMRIIRQQKRRVKMGLCVNCAYDLRASQDVCPECGKPVTATKPTQAP